MHHPALNELLEHLDGEIASGAQERLASHLEGCAECRDRLARLSMASVGIGERAVAPSTADEMATQRAKLRRKIAQAAAIPAPTRHIFAWSRSVAYAAALLVLTAAAGLFWQYRQRSADQAQTLPNPAVTPGVTRPVSLSDICVENDDEVVRSVPAAIEQKVFLEYGLVRAQIRDFEVDYLITPGLGGSDDVANLWPQPHTSQWNSYVKDQLEDHLHHMVCRGELPLATAQQAIASNWIAAYKKYFHTDQPLAYRLDAAPAEARLQRTALLRKHAGL